MKFKNWLVLAQRMLRQREVLTMEYLSLSLHLILSHASKETLTTYCWISYKSKKFMWYVHQLYVTLVMYNWCSYSLNRRLYIIKYPSNNERLYTMYNDLLNHLYSLYLKTVLEVGRSNCLKAAGLTQQNLTRICVPYISSIYKAAYLELRFLYCYTKFRKLWVAF